MDLVKRFQEKQYYKYVCGFSVKNGSIK